MFKTDVIKVAYLHIINVVRGKYWISGVPFFFFATTFLSHFFLFRLYSATFGLKLATTPSFYLLSLPSKRFNLWNHCSWKDVSKSTDRLVHKSLWYWQNCQHLYKTGSSFLVIFPVSVMSSLVFSARLHSILYGDRGILYLVELFMRSQS